MAHDPPRRLLVVDDDRLIREMVAMVLEEAGYLVEQASHGGLALARVAEHVPDLVLADVMMPVMDGVALSRELRARHAVPVILMSSAPPATLPADAADAFLRKPFELERLEALVGQVLAAASRRQPPRRPAG
jgi:two-component system response regulator MprA